MSEKEKEWWEPQIYKPGDEFYEGDGEHDQLDWLCDNLGDAQAVMEKQHAEIADLKAVNEKQRRFIHDLETRCDPAGEVRELVLTRDENAALKAKLAEAERGRKP